MKTIKIKRVCRILSLVAFIVLATALSFRIIRAETHKRALFEPAQGCYLGAYIDFDSTLAHTAQDQNGGSHALPETFEETVGKSHSVYFFYLGYGKRLPKDWVHELARHNKFVHIALEPNNGLDKVKDDVYLRGLADDLRESGARVFLRFASEMNGLWTHYHQNPALYRRKFRLVHDVMRQRAPNVALVWCPYVWPADCIPDYYPGDDATDWVGVNLYNVLFHDNRIDRPAEDERPVTMLQPFYDRYKAHKPIMICEYGVTHRTALDNQVRADYAADRITELYAALPKRFPRIKCINYFDGNTLEYVPGTAFNDYSVTNEPTVLGAYSAAISAPYFITGEPAAPAPIEAVRENTPVIQFRATVPGSSPLPLRLGVAAIVLCSGALYGYAVWLFRLSASEPTLTAVVLRPGVRGADTDRKN